MKASSAALMAERAEMIHAQIQKLLEKKNICVAIDGRCAAGKTTLAAYMNQRWQYPFLSMDHFFLPKERRTPQRLHEPGGNIDYERFIEEVLQPMRQGKSLTYRPYLCQSAAFGEKIVIEPRGVLLIEGSYSCHPRFRDDYDLTVFLTLDSREQSRRIERRNGLSAESFRELWIPLEEAYFEAFAIQESCDMVFYTDEEE